MTLVQNALWLSQQLIPPLLLTYFYFAWRLCTFEVGPLFIAQEYGRPLLGRVYSLLPTLLILPITVMYLRLYFLPSSQCVPPFDPSPAIQQRTIIFQCLSPAEAEVARLANTGSHDLHDIGRSDNEPMVERCYKGTCGGRWKPARSRHCSQCQTCRGGFDHHCPFFANCLTAAYMPTFLSLLLYTPPAVLILSIPLYVPLIHRAAKAYAISSASESIQSYWWDWSWSWVVAGGPVGRYAGGLILGWRELDRLDGGGVRRLNVGLTLGFGVILILITAGLAYSTISVLTSGNLTIDHGRSSAHAQALQAVRVLRQKDQIIPKDLEDKLKRFGNKKYFFVPVSREDSHDSHKTDSLIGEEQGQAQGTGRGMIVETLDHEEPYNHGTKKNLELVLGRGWGWLLPWRAVRRGLGEEVFMWPLAEGVDKRLREEAERRWLASHSTPVRELNSTSFTTNL